MSHSIGYYVHHVGRGHLHRAQALSAHHAALDGPEVVGLSSLARPEGWRGRWIELQRDDDPAPDPSSDRVDAGGRLHWAPMRHPGLRARAAAVSAFIERERPAAMVVDVSVEVLLLARLHGVPTVGVVLPGRRDDPAHTLGLDVADELVGFWPASAHGMLLGAPDAAARLHRLGALSRQPVAEPGTPVVPRSAVLLLGTGGGGDDETVERVLRIGRGWTWTVLGAGRWVEDPGAALRSAEVVVTHAGQGALADVAASRRPAGVVPQARPHDEQATTGAVLRAGGWPVLVRDRWPGVPEVLDRAAALDGGAWASWCDGRAVERLAEVVASLGRS